MLTPGDREHGAIGGEIPDERTPYQRALAQARADGAPRGLRRRLQIDMHYLMREACRNGSWLLGASPAWHAAGALARAVCDGLVERVEYHGPIYGRILGNGLYGITEDTVPIRLVRYVATDKGLSAWIRGRYDRVPRSCSGCGCSLADEPGRSRCEQCRAYAHERRRASDRAR